MRKQSSSAVILAFCVLLASSGCATLGPDHSVVRPLPEVPISGGLVVIADGAGDFRAASQAVQQAVAVEKLPLTVEPFVWSHGYLRILADQLDRGHARRQGHLLAEHVNACRHAYPNAPIYLIGHSAGSSVVLAAAAELPPGSLERIILLAPSVPADYDLRPALQAAREAVDVFCSTQDGWYLQTALWLSWLTGDKCHVAAGSVGFQPIGESPADRLAYEKLHHHRWGPALAWTGNEGGHFGCYQQGYLRTFVLPLMLPPVPQPHLSLR